MRREKNLKLKENWKKRTKNPLFPFPPTQQKQQNILYCFQRTTYENNVFVWGLHVFVSGEL